ncbi:FTR1 family protein, partial [uncultured Paracoccus sp.]|uniref:FTR1 family iron permease n=1 Tax=uncultured Paracoccus sp. TaxID=189685 RepID=UPI0025CC68DD
TTLHDSVDAALGGGTWALIGMVFLAVAREGLESIFFLLAILQQSRDAMAPLGAALGVLASAAMGWGIYAGALRLDLARFFRWTGVFILFVAAGLLAGSLKALHEAGVWNGLQARVYDLSHVLPETGPLGTVLAGILGYREAPSVGEVAVYLAFLAVMLTVFLRPDAAAAPRGRSVRDLT